MASIQARPTRRTRAKHKGEKPSVEDRLLQATERLLGDGNSFAGLSIEQLTKEAGMSRGTFYLHFKDKGDLVSRLMEHFTLEVTDSLGNWGNRPELASEQDVLDAVEGMVRNLFAHKAMTVAIRDTLALDEDLRKLLDQMIMHISEKAQQSVATVIERGDGTPGLTLEVGNRLTWTVALNAINFVDRIEDTELNSFIESLQHICVRAIFKQPKLP